MKKIFSLLLLITYISNAQSDYNKKTLFGNGISSDVWNKHKSGIEMYSTDQTPVGLMHTYNELKNVLAFYKLTDKDLVKNEILLPSYIKDITDFSKVSNAAYISNAEITKAWAINSARLIIVFSVRKDSNFVSIMQE